jgi:hypothetical protein
MVLWSKIVYHLAGQWTVLHVADYRGVLAYARQNEVDFIVQESVGEAASI